MDIGYVEDVCGVEQITAEAIYDIVFEQVPNF